MKITDGIGFDVVIETSGVSKCIQQCYDILGYGGLLELFACYEKNAKYQMDLDDFFWKEARIIGVFQSPYIYPRTVELLKRIDAKPFLQDVYKADDWKEAFEYRLTGIPQKVILDFTDAE